jgi:hypothetical protein
MRQLAVRALSLPPITYADPAASVGLLSELAEVVEESDLLIVGLK